MTGKNAEQAFFFSGHDREYKLCLSIGLTLAKWLMVFAVRQSRIESRKKASEERALDIERYFERITYHGSHEPILPTLQALHEAHLLAVPFENLDISLGRAIVLDEAGMWTKIVEHHRGGFCYELNGLFALLLRALGFQVDLLSASVTRSTGGFGPDFDHLTLLVHLEQDWLADVGFGESFRQPLLMQADLTQRQSGSSYRLECEDGSWIYQEWDDAWNPAYRFSLKPHALRDFASMCHYHQTSSESHFTQQRVCSLATPSGRITLSDQRLITTSDGKRTERVLTDQEYWTILAKQFGIVVSP
jgi:N-hydroxyarylamine O-acetyltransferase